MVVFHFQKTLRSPSIFKEFEFVFQFKKNWGCLLFSKKMRSSSIFHLVGLRQCWIPKINSLGFLEQNSGFIPFIRNWGCLPFSKILRSSFIFYLLRPKKDCILKISILGCLERFMSVGGVVQIITLPTPPEVEFKLGWVVVGLWQ
jgi:hypothetical protein